ncbi:PREDICTED: ankyrin repeat and EF-hand domain-containing protein 1-like [Branchiostoma belcheri]|uniref:Ankyrin repeat and EF-hand domain-containing protein 1-like n=1 Tax=Branchiostoma belcheri TaxID=7741 RepID=A0A6P4ZAX8_BRABE|nr:PREDICTED: ankyrin repeat and EF-hand domain-containing protein 1-like [Branchiostoma belcheri]
MAKNANEALLHAAKIGCLRGVKTALKAGADIDYAQEGNELTGSRIVRTALFFASEAGHADVVRLLIRKGASLTKRSTDTSAPPLLIAASEGHTKVVDLLVHHGATLDTRDCFQRTPLMMACIFRRADTIRRLIELGARVDLTDANGLTAQGYCELNVVGFGCVPKELMELIQEALRTKLLKCCNPTCGKPGYRSTLKICGQCKLTRYCSRDCQRQHWLAGHKMCCGHDAYSEDMIRRDFRKFQMRKYCVL